MDLIGLRLMVVIGLIALAGLAFLAWPLLSSLGARWRSYRDAAARAAMSAREGVEAEHGARARALQLRQMRWRSLL